MRSHTYFQPSVVWHDSQKMSHTECRPVSSIRSSDGPQPTFTLHVHEKRRYTRTLYSTVFRLVLRAQVTLTTALPCEHATQFDKRT